MDNMKKEFLLHDLGIFSHLVKLVNKHIYPTHSTRYSQIQYSLFHNRHTFNIVSVLRSADIKGACH